MTALPPSTVPPKLRRAHVVPLDYQRVFAAGERIVVIDKRTRVQRLQGTRDTVVSRIDRNENNPDTAARRSADADTSQHPTAIGSNQIQTTTRRKTERRPDGSQ